MAIVEALDVRGELRHVGRGPGATGHVHRRPDAGRTQWENSKRATAMFKLATSHEFC